MLAPLEKEKPLLKMSLKKKILKISLADKLFNLLLKCINTIIRLHLCHEEFKEKAFEYEMYWICDENHQKF
jgi:hypothetical protein